MTNLSNPLNRVVTQTELEWKERAERAEAEVEILRDTLRRLKSLLSEIGDNLKVRF